MAFKDTLVHIGQKDLSTLLEHSQEHAVLEATLRNLIAICNFGDRARELRPALNEAEEVLRNLSKD